MEFYPEGNNQSPEGKAATLISLLVRSGESAASLITSRGGAAPICSTTGAPPNERSFFLPAYMTGTRPLPVLGRERLRWRERAETLETRRCSAEEPKPINASTRLFHIASPCWRVLLGKVGKHPERSSRPSVNLKRIKCLRQEASSSLKRFEWSAMDEVTSLCTRRLRDLKDSDFHSMVWPKASLDVTLCSLLLPDFRENTTRFEAAHQHRRQTQRRDSLDKPVRSLPLPA